MIRARTFLLWTVIAAPAMATAQPLADLEIAERNAVEHLWNYSIQIFRIVEAGTNDFWILRRYPEALDLCTRLSGIKYEQRSHFHTAPGRAGLPAFREKCEAWYAKNRSRIEYDSLTESLYVGGTCATLTKEPPFLSLTYGFDFRGVHVYDFYPSGTVQARAVNDSKTECSRISAARVDGIISSLAEFEKGTPPEPAPDMSADITLEFNDRTITVNDEDLGQELASLLIMLSWEIFGDSISRRYWNFPRYGLLLRQSQEPSRKR